MNCTEEREERLYGSEKMEDTGQTQFTESRIRAQALVMKGSTPDALYIYYVTLVLCGLLREGVGLSVLAGSCESFIPVGLPCPASI